jgi:hypothetical protein
MTTRLATAIMAAGLATALVGCGSEGSHAGATDPLRHTDWTTATNYQCPSTDQRVLLDQAAYGDFTGDGVNDAVVSLTCSTTTSSNPVQVAAFDGASEPAHPRLIGVLLSDRDPALYVEHVQLAVTANTIRLSGNGIGPDEALATSPHIHLEQTFTFSDGRLTPGPRQMSR